MKSEIVRAKSPGCLILDSATETWQGKMDPWNLNNSVAWLRLALSVAMPI